MGYWDYYRGPSGTIIGIHSPISLLRTRELKVVQITTNPNNYSGFYLPQVLGLGITNPSYLGVYRV